MEVSVVFLDFVLFCLAYCVAVLAV